eukprot:2150599-Rhodomonas_salina.1
MLHTWRKAQDSEPGDDSDLKGVVCEVEGREGGEEELSREALQRLQPVRIHLQRLQVPAITIPADAASEADAPSRKKCAASPLNANISRLPVRRRCFESPRIPADPEQDGKSGHEVSVLAAEPSSRAAAET